MNSALPLIEEISTSLIRLGVLGILLVVAYFGCRKEITAPAIDPSQIDLSELQVPEGFDFRTYRTLEILMIDDDQPVDVLYKFYALFEDGDKQLLGTGGVDSGRVLLYVDVPDYCQSIRVDRYKGESFTSKIFDATGTRVVGSFRGISGKRGSYAGADTDNDGVIDSQDDYPNDPTAAYSIHTPSDTGWASLAFEDLWPSRGDYDFNDLVIDYRFTEVLNKKNKIVRI